MYIYVDIENAANINHLNYDLHSRKLNKRLNKLLFTGE